MLCADSPLLTSLQAQSCSGLRRLPRVGHLQAMWEVFMGELEEGALKSQPIYPDTYQGAD